MAAFRPPSAPHRGHIVTAVEWRSRRDPGGALAPHRWSAPARRARRQGGRPTRMAGLVTDPDPGPCGSGPFVDKPAQWAGLVGGIQAHLGGLDRLRLNGPGPFLVGLRPGPSPLRDGLESTRPDPVRFDRSGSVQLGSVRRARSRTVGHMIDCPFARCPCPFVRLDLIKFYFCLFPSF